MANNNLEDGVRLACLDRLKQWRDWGIVVDLDDVHDTGKHCIRGVWVMRTEKGKRDVVAWFKVGSILWTYLIECKAPDGGDWNEHQQKYAKKFEGLDNVVYEVVSDAKQIDQTLERLTKRSEKLLDEASEHLFPTLVEETF